MTAKHSSLENTSSVSGQPHGGKQYPTDRRIAIIGMSGRFPGGATSPERLWELLLAGIDGVTEAQGDRWDLGWHHPDPNRDERVYTRSGGFLDRIDGFDAEFFGISPKEARQVDPQHRLLLELAWEAMEDANLAPRRQAGTDMGVFVGISGNDYANLVGPQGPDAYSNTGSAISIAANRISYIFDLHGPSVAVDTACSSSLVCIHQACVSLLSGECSMALAGGVNLLVHVRSWVGFSKASMLSPTGRCKSFDASGDGYVRSEGGALVMLKPLEAAERDGDRILGVILASGVNSDGRTLGLSMPNEVAQERLLRKVYGQSGLKAEDVFYVEAHGTGTSVGDPIECEALGRVLGEPRRDGSECYIGSVKSNIGHLESASGVAGLTKVLLSLRHRLIPANLHFHTPNPKIHFDDWKLSVVSKPLPIPETEKPVVIGVNSFGFGGTNSHVVVQEYRPAKTLQGGAELSIDREQVLVLSGHTQAALKAVAESYEEFLERPSTFSFEDICAAVATCRSPQRTRLALVAYSAHEAVGKLRAYLEGKTVPGLAVGSTAAPVVPLAFVFSGNGPQWWGMGRELLRENKLFRAALEQVDGFFAPLAGWSLIDEMGRSQAESRVGLTEYAQPLLFALQVGLVKVLEDAGVVPSVVVGHSVGEVAAAYTSGALTLEDATRVIYLRSREQAKTAGTGKMAALGVGVEAAREAIAEVGGWMEVAAENAPEAVTVAGDPEALDALLGVLTERGRFARMLQLDYPFHTRAMESIREGLLENLSGLSPRASSVPFVSTVTGGRLPGEELNADYWYRNVRERVEFRRAISCLIEEQHVGVFLEIGPHPVLKEYVQQTAKVERASTVALQTLRRPTPKVAESETENLRNAICGCYANGGVDLERAYRKPLPAPDLPLYPWQRVQHWRGYVALPDLDHHTHRDHPLLGYPVTTGEGIWENTIDLNQIPYLRDHVVQRSVVFPAAGYIEMAFSAAQRLLGNGTLVIEDLEILRPFALAEHSDPILQFSVDGSTGNFVARSRQEAYARDWVRHVRGRISRNEFSRSDDRSSIGEIRARLPVVVDAGRHYQVAAMRGMEYGPSFQCVQLLQMSRPDAELREVLVSIQLQADPATDLTSYRAHPVIFDACLQAMITLIDQNEMRKCSLIPVRFGKILSHAPLVETTIAHLTLLQESERSAVAELTLRDIEGNLLLEIQGARCQKVDFASVGATPLIASWWKIDSRREGHRELPALVAPSEMVSFLIRQAKDLAKAADRDAFYEEIEPEMNLLARAYFDRAIRRLSVETERIDVGGPVAFQSQNSAAERLLNLAWSEGLIERAGTEWKSSHSIDVDAEELWRRLFFAYPRYQAELLQIAQTGEYLHQAVIGAVSASEMAIEPLFDTAPFQLVYNQIMRAALEEIVRLWPKHRPIRILELGGGSGELTAWLLPMLCEAKVDYLFTDSSEALIGRAEHRFSSYRQVRFEALDLDRDLVEQGLPANYFDLVIAGNALHAAEEPSALLRSLRSVLASDALLLALEARRSSILDLMFFFAPSWSSDSSSPAASRLLEPDQWLAQLASAGFSDCAVVSDVVANQGRQPQQSVYVAQIADGHESRSLPEESTFNVPASMILVVEPTDQAEELRMQQRLVSDLAGHGCAVKVHNGAPGSFASLWKEGKRADSVVYLASPPPSGDDHSRLLEQQTSRCLTVLEVVRSLESTRLDGKTRLTLVTRGAFTNAFGEGPLDSGQGPLWGLGRVIANEHPGLECFLVDLHEMPDDRAVLELARELVDRDEENEVQLESGFRFLNRERVVTLTEEARFNPGNRPEAFQLDFTPQGGLDSLYLRSRLLEEPGPGKVQIAVHAAGLNFRDILWTMGMLPEEAVEEGFSGPTIGMECAGEVVRVGDGVTGLKRGDKVVAFASSCFASHVTTDAESACLLPPKIDYAEAATIPTAFLTAYYALDHLASLQPGESILIHGAAGGVGIAAIQIAKMKGATVFGTAGSERKRHMLRLVGVDHVLNSRSLAFADEIMSLTAGKGIDVVLNSLAGEAITRSLKCLKPFGRFLEIGKRDLYANTHLGLRPFRRNLSYFAIDADTLLIERRALARKLFQEVMEHVTSGALRPLPFETIPISRAAEAFRAMQQSRHIGKLVLSMELDPAGSLPVVQTGSPVSSGRTYVISGGLGGFGLATARWLVDEGATAVALLGRRGAATDEAKRGIAELEREGASVKAVAVDITDATALASAFEEIRQTMPPIGGVIHSAAVIEDAPIGQIGEELLDRVFGPKIVGAWNLHRESLKDPIEMFVVYSSSSTVVGNPGQGAYVAGNLYLDALAQYRRSLGLPGLAVGWGAIKDVGFLTRHGNVAEMLRTRTGMDATPADEALNELRRLLSAGSARMCVARFDLSRLGRILPGTLVPRFMPIVTPSSAVLLTSEETLAARLQQAAPEERRSMLVESIREYASKVLGSGSAQIAIDQPLADLGLDSLMAVELAVAIERDLERPLSVMQLLNAGNINAIADLAMKVMGFEKNASVASQDEREPVLVGQRG